MKDDRVIGKVTALQIIYYLMAVDGEICQAEEEKFDSIGNELMGNEMDDSFDGYSFDDVKQEILEECKEQLDKVVDQDEYYDVIREGVEACFEQEEDMYYSDDEVIKGSMLIWNLLAIAFSDGEYSKDERRLIKMVGRKLNLDKTMFLELENSIKAVFALDKEEEWLKTTDRPYKTIEDMISEVSNRRDVIMQSVNELMED